jgi:hypothetical protein
MTTKADAGDISVPRFTTQDGREFFNFIPNAELGFGSNEPVCVMVDEVGKGPNAVKTAINRFLNEHAVGTFKLPEGSIVFGTTNLTSEGVGDILPPHARNRVTVVKIRKPTSTEWIENFAMRNAIDPIVIAAVMEYPSCFQSYEDEGSEGNHYIYHPKVPRPAFVSPRSLERASHIIKGTQHLTDDIRTHALIGTVGEAFALDLMTLARLDEQLPTLRQIAGNPEMTKVPDSGVACVMLATKIALNADISTIEALLDYVFRMPKEIQVFFGKSIINSPNQKIAITCGKFTDWCQRMTILV